jgi:hypothetical protein
MEWCINLHAEFLEHLTLLRSWWHFISIDDVPSLTKFVTFVLNNDVSIFSIIITLDGHDLSVIVDELVALPSEELEPSSIGGSHVQVV